MVPSYPERLPAHHALPAADHINIKAFSCKPEQARGVEHTIALRSAAATALLDKALGRQLPPAEKIATANQYLNTCFEHIQWPNAATSPWWSVADSAQSAGSVLSLIGDRMDSQLEAVMLAAMHPTNAGAVFHAAHQAATGGRSRFTLPDCIDTEKTRALLGRHFIDNQYQLTLEDGAGRYYALRDLHTDALRPRAYATASAITVIALAIMWADGSISLPNFWTRYVSICMTIGAGVMGVPVTRVPTRLRSFQVVSVTSGTVSVVLSTAAQQWLFLALASPTVAKKAA